MKGIVLAGGTGSRLWPITWGVPKPLIPVYDKPLVHYPISTLMLAGIREILIITTDRDQDSFKRLLGDGKKYGVNFFYRTQEKPEGIAQAFIIGESFIGQDNCCLILGDNIFYGTGLGTQLQSHSEIDGAVVFAYKVKDPERYGVIELDKKGSVLSIEEKPKEPKSQYAATGLYFYDHNVVDIAKSLKPSARGELEITDVNKEYLKLGRLRANILERGTVWLDTGTFESLNDASNFVHIVEERQNLKVACLEEIAWRQGWISDQDLVNASNQFLNSPYGQYLKEIYLSSVSKSN